MVQQCLQAVTVVGRDPGFLPATSCYTVGTDLKRRSVAMRYALPPDWLLRQSRSLPSLSQEPELRRSVQFGPSGGFPAGAQSTNSALLRGEPDLDSSTPGPSSRAIIANSESRQTAMSGRMSRNRTADAPDAGAVFTLAVVRLASFTDVFLTGLLVPLIPNIVQGRTQVPSAQVQIWTSILLSTYGGAFVAASPLLPLMTRDNCLLPVILAAGLACAGGALYLLQHYSSLPLLLFSRAIHGLAAVAITGACSAIISSTTDARNKSRLSILLQQITPALMQSAAMSAAPPAAGLLHDYVGGETAVFLCAYALLGLNVILCLFVGIVAWVQDDSSGGINDDGQALLVTATPPLSYGTISPDSGFRASTRKRHAQGNDMQRDSLSVQSARKGYPVRELSTNLRVSNHDDTEPIQSSTAPAAPSHGSNLEVQSCLSSPRLLAAMFGYLVVGFLSTALQSVLPLFVQRTFNWSVFASGLIFLPLSLPTTLVGPITGLLTRRTSNASRFLASSGFLICLPPLLLLGRLTENSSQTQIVLLAVLATISFGLGLCGDPIVKEIAQTTIAHTALPGSSTNEGRLGSVKESELAVQASSLSSLSYAWGSLIGPLFTGAISWVWNWEAMNRSLGVVSGSSGVLTLLFLQGWIGNLRRENRSRMGPVSDGGESRSEINSLSKQDDEEAEPGMQHGRNAQALYDGDVPSFLKSEQGHCNGGYEQIAHPKSTKTTDDSQNTDASRARTNHSGARSQGSQGSQGSFAALSRRQFVVDHLSVSTTAPSSIAAAGLEDSEYESAELTGRFHTVLESPVVVGTTIEDKTTEQRGHEHRHSTASSIDRGRQPLKIREVPHVPNTEAVLAAGNRYMIEGHGLQPSLLPANRQVVVFDEDSAPPPEVLQHRKHHVVTFRSDGTTAIGGAANSVTTTAKASAGPHVMLVEEQIALDVDVGQNDTSRNEHDARRYIVVILDKGENNLTTS
ncbi:major facilitator superfamily domain-containing protein [Diplogelasinospora grovesii]|uniref:Major facilitator superfamily domain-containing protein n=1 Tax=Diplogelasinospora grovesii TaxID=303347 RepID=A0AAN6NA14_9PEZI|nr:major facilitator superfamily domain-containing protein [Diplogelasinospora grovesii]